MVSDAHKCDVSKNVKHYRLNGNKYEMRGNMSTRKCHIGVGAQKFSSAKISTFTALIIIVRFGFSMSLLHQAILYGQTFIS